jgi:hypothetical protein
MLLPHPKCLVEEFPPRAPRLTGTATIVLRRDRLVASLHEFSEKTPYGARRDFQFLGNHQGRDVFLPATKKSFASSEQK